MKLTKFEENHINPKIEAKVSFSAAPAVTNALEALDKGDALTAEKKLRAHLARHPDDINALLTAIHVYQQTSNLDQLNAMYGRLIRHHLANQDKEAALYAYDGLPQLLEREATDGRKRPLPKAQGTAVTERPDTG